MSLPTITIAGYELESILSGLTLTATVVGQISVSWTQKSGPGTVTFTAPTAVSTNASFDLPGIYIVTLSATNGTGTCFVDLVIYVYNQDAVPIANPTINEENP